MNTDIVSESNLKLPSNQLASEKSPYLQQHASNPVAWYPWGEEAFKKASLENKPIVLSIGYSTCHWCHVMEEESFSDKATAKIMNDHFVSIKVDREERPDIDSVYMSYVMATTGSGGWPMTVFLTPDKKPFYGGTYFPPQDRYGMPGFKTLLNEIASAWTHRRDEILNSANSSEDFLNKQDSKPLTEATNLDQKTLDGYFESCDSMFDTQYGGFGRAPKFPRSHGLSLLLRYHKRTGNQKALQMAEITLDAMASSGMHDLLEGGFHRYSTDAQWRIPHFEKMLYDQALLAKTYTETYQITKNQKYAKTAKSILDYVIVRMTDSQGGFYCAEDADSADMADQGKKKEGTFYLWTQKEIQDALGEVDAPLFIYRYGIESQGNALSDPHGELTNKNALYEKHSIQECAEHFSLTLEKTSQLLDNAKAKLLTIRSRRPRPFLDDKILTDWNALMIEAFCQAWQVYGEQKYQKAALEAATFIKNNLQDQKGRLLHRFRGGNAGIDGGISDYAFLIQAYTSVYESTFDESWLVEAKRLADLMIDLFWDKNSGGFYLTSSEAEKLIVRPKEIYDGAVPSGNSVAAQALERLSRFLEDERYAEYSRKTLDAFSYSLHSAPMSYPQFLMALDAHLGPCSEIALISERESAWVKEALKEIHLRFIPNKIIMLRTKNDSILPAISRLADDGAVGSARVYMCQGKACGLPITKIEDLKKKLES